MGQVHVRVILTNYRKQSWRDSASSMPVVHRYETEAFVDTGAIQCVIPQQSQNLWDSYGFGRTEARFVNNQVKELMCLKSLPSRLWAVRRTKT